MNIIACYIITYIIEAFILFQYCSHLFYPKLPNYINLLFIGGLYSVLFFTSCLNLAWLNILAFVIINFIYIKIAYQVKYSAALFHAAITTTIMGMSELIVFSIRTYFTSNFYEEYDLVKNLITLGIFSKTLYFGVLQLILRLFKPENKSYTKTSPLLTSVPVATLFVMTTLFVASLTSSPTLFVDWMISISAFLLLITNMIVFGIHNYTQRKETELAELRLQFQKEYDASEYRKELLKESENRSILIHDIKKHLNSISALNKEGDSLRVATYIDALINSTSLQTSVRVCDNDMLNIILGRYIHHCKQKGISIHTDIRSKCLKFISDDDLTALFCNLLDNAIDAASVVPNGYIDINALHKENTSFTLITIINSCRETPFDDFGNLIIRKNNKEQHGFGMKSIKRIVTKYGGEMSYYYDAENATFHVIIIVSNMY